MLTARPVPVCQHCCSNTARGVLVHNNESCSLVCSASCSTAFSNRSATSLASAGRDTFGFLIDSNVIPLLKPHAGLLHQYIAYNGCADVTHRLGFTDVPALWADLSKQWPFMTARRFVAGVLWSDLALCNVDDTVERLSASEAADVMLFLTRCLTPAVMDAYASESGAFIVPAERENVPYLSAPDATAFCVEPAGPWALAFGIALALDGTGVSPTVNGQNAAMLHLHPAMQVLHFMSNGSGESLAQTLSRERVLFTYLLTRAFDEKDAFLLGILAHAVADSFSTAHTKRESTFPCRLSKIRAFHTHSDSSKHAAHEGAAAVFSDASTGAYTPEYAHLVPASIMATDFVVWLLARLVAHDRVAGDSWLLAYAWGRHVSSELTSFSLQEVPPRVNIQDAVDYMFRVFFA